MISSIGGEDELKVLARLDSDVLATNPKPFFGYSDNTNLHLYLWNLGLVSYHGCAVMVQLGRPGSMHPLTLESLRRALFTHETYTWTPADEYTDEEGDWNDPDGLDAEPTMLPSASYVYRVLMGMGERGLLARFLALLWGLPKAWSHAERNSPDERVRYVAAQRTAVLTAL